MSHVDNVILTFSILEDANTLMGPINEWLQEHTHGHFGLGLMDLPGAYGGSKALETPLYVAAFNYLPEDDFLAMLRRQLWLEPAHVQVLIQRQHDDVLSVLTLEKP